MMVYVIGVVLVLRPVREIVCVAAKMEVPITYLLFVFFCCAALLHDLAEKRQVV